MVREDTARREDQQRSQTNKSRVLKQSYEHIVSEKQWAKHLCDWTQDLGPFVNENSSL